MANNIDWGGITPQGYNQEKNEALHVCNFDLSSEDKIENVILFIIGKILWAKNHLPKGCNQLIVFDVRGQELGDNTINDLVDIIKKKISYVDKNYSNYSINFKFS